jgi:glycosyltransferase involved in cell wall biosynthesis
VSARRRGVRIVQRLDGMNWLHRLSPPLGRSRPGMPRPGVRHYLRAEWGNLLLRLIRARLASQIVYQSEFSRSWWERQHGPTPVACQVIYNGVDLNVYSPAGAQSPPGDRWRVLMVEGSLMGGYEQGLEAAAACAVPGRWLWCSQTGRPVELLVVGRVSQAICSSGRAAGRQQRPGQLLLNWAGLVERSRVPEFDRSAHLLTPRTSTQPARIQSSKPWPADCRWSPLIPARCQSW